ncbi:uncharacterized protein J8A68_004544 [[Candida] subhashii]|uniref:Uncharacterized protein n=1 Tax=[Candida] subhashii TaxID=561895 RepID=A0A8J5QAZ1_9ASCO|nr:uncharacterized protein J8A68_004544 [[Candida] subhashii]KAG7661941.1 hypothetical protein J8A68_004544 [[Candida] subhashii]
MFSRISDRFHKSNNQKAKLLNFTEFYELDNPIKKQYFRGLFHKHQAGARKISQEFHQQLTSDTSSSIYSTEPSSSIYSDVAPANSNNISPYTQTDSYSIGNNRKSKLAAFKNKFIKSSRYDSDTNQPERSFKVLRVRKHVFEPSNGMDYYIDLYAPGATAPIRATSNNRKSFYMLNNDKEEEELMSQTREKITSFRDYMDNKAKKPIRVVRVKRSNPAATTTPVTATNKIHLYSVEDRFGNSSRYLTEIDITQGPIEVVGIKSQNQNQFKPQFKISKGEDRLADIERCWKQINVMMEDEDPFDQTIYGPGHASLHSMHCHRDMPRCQLPNCIRTHR